MNQIANEKALGVVAIDGIAVVSSRDVSEIFNKNHQHVLEAIRSCQCSNEFSRSNFRQSKYKDSRGKIQPEILLTKNRFAFIVMGLTGKKAALFKEAYITRFDEMEQFIRSRHIARLEYPELTNMIKLVFNNPEWHYYSNEADMINRIVLGMSAKEFREENNIPKDASIRDYLTPRQAELIQKLQNFDIGLVATISGFHERKAALKAYQARLHIVSKITA